MYLPYNQYTYTYVCIYIIHTLYPNVVHAHSQCYRMSVATECASALHESRCINHHGTKASLYRNSVHAVYSVCCTSMKARARAYVTTKYIADSHSGKQTQSNQFARLIDFPSHARCRAHCASARKCAPQHSSNDSNIERQSATRRTNPIRNYRLIIKRIPRPIVNQPLYRTEGSCWCFGTGRCRGSQISEI